MPAPEMKFEPGWLKKDMERASERADQWRREHPMNHRAIGRSENKSSRQGLLDDL